MTEESMFLFGMTVGLLIPIGILVFFRFRSLQKQIAFLTGRIEPINKTDPGEDS